MIYNTYSNRNIFPIDFISLPIYLRSRYTNSSAPSYSPDLPPLSPSCVWANKKAHNAQRFATDELAQATITLWLHSQPQDF